MSNLRLSSGGRIKEFTFPDGQPHVEVQAGFGKDITIVARFHDGNDILRTLLAAEAARYAGVARIHLQINYLLGARMDRRMPVHGTYVQPFTLQVIAEMLKGKFDSISVFDPHSDVACALLGARPILPTAQVRQTIDDLNTRVSDIVLAAPDAGAVKKVEDFAMQHSLPVAICLKHRDMATGNLSGFSLASDPAVVEGHHCLIVDDICDGGGTFTGVANVLRSAGAESVHLYVTHGIFSKGVALSGIDRIYTTNSYQDFEDADLPESMRVWEA